MRVASPCQRQAAEDAQLEHCAHPSAILCGSEGARQLHNGFVRIALSRPEPGRGKGHRFCGLPAILTHQMDGFLDALCSLAQRSLQDQYSGPEREQFGSRQRRLRLAHRRLRLLDGGKRPVRVVARLPQARQCIGGIPYRIETPAPFANLEALRQVRFRGLQFVSLDQHLTHCHVEDAGRRQTGHFLRLHVRQSITTRCVCLSQVSQQAQRSNQSDDDADADDVGDPTAQTDVFGVRADGPLEVTYTIVGRRQRKRNQRAQLHIFLG